MNNQKLPSFKGLKPQRPSLKSPGSSKIQTPIVPPVLHEVGKLAAGVAAVNTGGSATGNPRNKCALQPGHSLMDWIRLGSSGKDLTGIGNRAGSLNVTLKELEEHDKEIDAWLAIRGRVYNITHYIPFHPGGPDEIMKGAGKDATNLFDQIHPWVNYDQILNKCLIGRLVTNDSDLTVDDLFGNRTKTAKHDKQSLKSSSNDTPNAQINNNEINADSTQQIQDDSTTNTTPAPPRFDWIQKMDSLTTIFYTKSYSNPQIEVNPPNQENIINIFIQFDSKYFVNELRFSKSVQWPCQIKINYETGKIELIFKKNESQIWEHFGTLKQRYEEHSVATDSKLKYSVVNKVQVNQNTFLLELERVDSTKLTVPLGKHVRVFGKVKGEEMSRSYTPVPNSLFTKYKPQVYTTDNVCLMVKSYPNGNISRFICSKNKYDIVELSRPLGTFNLADFEQKELFLMLAAGTGLTPMLGLLSFVLERRVRKCQSVSLLFFNRAEDDILFRAQFDKLQKEDSRFNVSYILSRPSSKWKGPKGHVTSEILRDTLEHLHDNTAYTRNDIYVTVCGPTIFTNLAQSLLKELAVSEEQTHLFLG